MLRGQLAYKILLFMEPGFSLSSLQKPATGPYPELHIQKLLVCDRIILAEMNENRKVFKGNLFNPSMLEKIFSLKLANILLYFSTHNL
jgi:hypothetical protein